MAFEGLPPEYKESLARSWAMRKALNRYPIDRELARAACADGKLESMSTFCTFLSANLSQRRRKQNAGEKHLATRAHADKGYLPDWIISAFITEMLTACRMRECAPPMELCDLIEMQLRYKTGQTGYRDAKKVTAMFEAMYLLAHTPDANASEVAKAVGVSHTTVMRWQQDSDFLELLTGMTAGVDPHPFQKALNQSKDLHQVE